MENRLKQYHRLKEEVERKEKEFARAEGALEEIKRRLKDECGTPSVKQARKKLAELDEEQRELEKEFNKMLAEFEDKWKEKV